MEGQATPYITPDLPGIGGAIKARPEDFVVEEIPLYLPEGAGEHLYLTIRRQGRNTRDLVQGLAAALGVDRGQVGYAGMKDKNALTTQTFSVQLPVGADDEALAGRVADELGVEVLGAARHRNKLKRGHLVGNRFTVVVSGVEAGDALAAAQAVAVALGERGLPNFYGVQRFGLEGDNAARGRQALLGRGPRQRWLRSLLLNAFQSALFNRWLATRMERGLFGELMEGDVAKKTATGGVFTVEDLAAEAPRFAAGEITYTGPIYGSKMTWAAGPAGELEREILADEGVEPGQLKKAGLLGSRRPARLLVEPLEISPDPRGLCFQFALPKGSYATTLLREFMKADLADGEDED